MCGTDGCQYPSPCILHQHACQNGLDVRVASRGLCEVTPSPQCPCFDTPTAQLPQHPNVTVYLNASEMIQLAAAAPKLVECSLSTISRYLRRPDIHYARIFHAMEVLSALEITPFNQEPANKILVAQNRIFNLENLENQPLLQQAAAIVHALSVLDNIGLLCQIPSPLPSIEKVLGLPVFLPCGAEGIQRTFLFNGYELKENRPHIKFLENGLLISNTRPIDEGLYTCVVDNSCGPASTATYIRVLCKCIH